MFWQRKLFPCCLGEEGEFVNSTAFSVTGLWKRPLSSATCKSLSQVFVWRCVRSEHLSSHPVLWAWIPTDSVWNEQWAWDPQWPSLFAVLSLLGLFRRVSLPSPELWPLWSSQFLSVPLSTGKRWAGTAWMSTCLHVCFCQPSSCFCERIWASFREGSKIGHCAGKNNRGFRSQAFHRQ